MESRIYDLNGVDINQVFERIDSFIGFDFQEFLKKQPRLTEDNIKTLKILLSDLYSLDGLTPKELQKREKFIFDLTSIVNLHYSKITVDLMNSFFILPTLKQ